MIYDYINEILLIDVVEDVKLIIFKWFCVVFCDFIDFIMDDDDEVSYSFSEMLVSIVV